MVQYTDCITVQPGTFNPDGPPPPGGNGETGPENPGDRQGDVRTVDDVGTPPGPPGPPVPPPDIGDPELTTLIIVPTLIVGCMEPGASNFC